VSLDSTGGGLVSLDSGGRLQLGQSERVRSEVAGFLAIRQWGLSARPGGQRNEFNTC
jgi:hypothetical protein